MAGPHEFPDTAELERAANLIVDVLPTYMQDPVREMAYVYGRQPLWSLVAGHLIAAYEQGTISAPITDPGWPPHFGAVGVDLPGSRYQCQRCRTVFVPTRYKQAYCTTACGAEAAAEQADGERAAAVEEAAVRA